MCFSLAALIIFSAQGWANTSQQEVWSADQTVRSHFSLAAHQTSNFTLIGSTLSPMLVIVGGHGSDGPKLRAVAIYGTTFLSNLALTFSTKYYFRRPRPYTHNPSQAAQNYAATQGDENTLSFYSGHASTSFSSASAGSVLGSPFLGSDQHRRALWGSEFAMAGATAILRVRAGKHYYSDVLVGALLGTANGYGISRLMNPDLESPHPSYCRAAVIGTIIGSLSYLFPFSEEENVTMVPFWDGEVWAGKVRVSW